MPFTVKDRVRETSVTTGVGEYTLAGAPVGFQAFSAIGAGNTCPYFATDSVNWEVGIGTVLAGPARLQRTSILASSNGGAAVNWGVGTREIICGMPAALGFPRVVTKSVAGGVDVNLTADEMRADLIILTGALTANINVNVDAAPWRWSVYNNTGGAFTLTFKTSAGAGVVITQATRASLLCDGVDVVKSDSGPLAVPDGSAAAPSLRVGDEQNGLYSPAANQLAVALAGVAAANWSATGLRLGSATAANSPFEVLADGSAIGVTAIGRAADGVSVMRGVNNAYSAELGRIQFENGQLKIGTGTAGTERLRIIDSNGAITTGATAAAATGYTSAGDITLPTAGKIRARNTTKASVNFNGTGVVAIRNSQNVSSITDHATGAYSVNFTTGPATNSAYNVTALVGAEASANRLIRGPEATPTTSAFRVQTFDNTFNAVDSEWVMLQFEWES